MFESILIPVAIVSGLGLIAGVGLSIATIIFQVPVNEKEAAVRNLLPGINCGACGFSGCDGYAKALAAGTAEANLCAPGGAEVRQQISSLLGVEAAELRPTAAFVSCNGRCGLTSQKMTYQGAATCYAANQIFGGQQSCQYGCMGFGDCVTACAYDAIHVVDGVAEVDPLKCVGCLQCIAVCPKQLISMKPITGAPAVACRNLDRGGSVRKICEVGCITCNRCVKACPTDAITIENNVAVIDFAKCTDCGECIAVCPQDCIVKVMKKTAVTA